MKEAHNGTEKDSTALSFIKSSPIGQDLLEGRAHEQIAKHIASLIKSNNAENKLLGLDGAWGSGKSNLIKILKSKLSETHHFFIYDAWGHQEDLQRRSFLEELTRNLCDQKVIDGWEKKLKDLLSRRRELTTKTIPRLSPVACAVIFAFVFTSPALALARWVDNSFFSLLITVIPTLIAIAIYRFSDKKEGGSLSLSDVCALYRYKSEELSNETHITVFEKEPSVSEFQKWMKDLSDALGKNKNKNENKNKTKLVIVFDNMDRLPPDKVRELWASIHTFFAEEVSFDNFWVIVPFDTNHISKAFISKSEKNAKRVSEEYLRKSFSLIYRVAPLVLTDWQKFFNLKFKEAFGDSEQEELHYVRKVFDRLQKEITPRNIIAFINEMVLLRQTVEEEILLRYIALFVLTKKEVLASPVDAILGGKYLEGAEALFAEDEELPNYIAALVYQVPLSSASQVMLTREIQNSLNNQDKSRLNQLARHPHFVAVLEQAVLTEDLDFDEAVATLAELDLQDANVTPEDRIRIVHIWDDHFCAPAIRAPVTGQKFTHTYDSLLRWCSTPWKTAFVKHFIKEIRDADNFDGGEYYQALSNLQVCIKKHAPDIDISSLVTDLIKPPSDFIPYVSVAGDDYRRFRLKCRESELQSYLIERISDDLEVLSVMSVVAGDYKLDPIVQKLERKIEDGVLTVGEIGPLYKAYKTLAKEKPIKTMDFNQVADFLPQTEEGSEIRFDLLAMRLVAGEKFRYIGSIEQSILSQTDEDTVSRIAESIEYFITYGDLLLAYLDWQQPVLKAVLKKLTLNGYETSKLDIAKVLERYGELQASLEITPLDFIGRLNHWHKDAKKRITAENIRNHITDAVFFKHAVQRSCELTHYLIEKMIEALNSMSADDWRSDLKEVNSFTFRVTHELLKEDNLGRIPDDATMVYKELLLETAKGDFQMEGDDRWDVFYEKFDKRKLRPTVKDIRDLFISDVTITPEKFLFFSKMLLSYGDLGKRSADVTRKILAPVCEDEDCFQFILSNDQQFIPIINDAKDDAADFKDTVRKKLSGSESDKKLIRFAKAIGIKVSIA